MTESRQENERLRIRRALVIGDRARFSQPLEFFVRQIRFNSPVDDNQLDLGLGIGSLKIKTQPWHDTNVIKPLGSNSASSSQGTLTIRAKLSIHCISQGLSAGIQGYRPPARSARQSNNKRAFATDCRTLAGTPPALIFLALPLPGFTLIAMASSLGRQELEALVIDMLS